MPGSSNLLLHDPNFVNILSDVSYSADMGRQNGEVSGQASSARYNKAMAQASFFPYIAGQIMASLGYTVADNDPADGIIQFQNTFANTLGVNAQTGTSYTLQASDRNKLVTFNNSSAVSVIVPQAGSGTSLPNFQNFFEVSLINLGTGPVTLTPTVSTIDGGSSLVLNQYQGVTLFSDNTNYICNRGLSAAFPTGFHGSAVPAYASSTTITLANIRERDSSDTTNIINNSSSTLSISGTGLNGLDTGTVATNTMYYLYAVTNGTTTGLMASTVNENAGGSISAANYAYTKKRQLLFAFRTDGSSHILPFIVACGWPHKPLCLYTGFGLSTTFNGSFTAGANNIVNNGNPTSLTLASASSLIPAISKLGIFQGFMTGNSIGSLSGDGVNVNTSFGAYAGGIAAGPFMLCPTTSSQAIYYKQYGGSNVYLDVLGWIGTENV